MSSKTSNQKLPTSEYVQLFRIAEKRWAREKLSKEFRRKLYLSLKEEFEKEKK